MEIDSEDAISIPWIWILRRYLSAESDAFGDWNWMLEYCTVLDGSELGILSYYSRLPELDISMTETWYLVVYLCRCRATGTGRFRGFQKPGGGTRLAGCAMAMGSRWSSCRREKMSDCLVEDGSRCIDCCRLLL